jgi:outer membrane protein assembly factor BamA
MKWTAQLCSSIAMLLMMSGVAAAQQTTVKPVIGGFPADSGFSAGAELIRHGLAGPIDGRIKGVLSVKKYELMEAGVEMPELRPWLSLRLTGRYRNYPQEDFWGIGNDTREDQRTNYLLEDVDGTATLETSFRKFRAGISGGYLKINTGPGRDKNFPSTPESLQLGPSYRHAGFFLGYHSLDSESDPHKGGRYTFDWTAFTSSFHRYVIDVRRFVPITADSQLALRAETIFTHSSRGEEIPFFMLPTAGGNDTVRGFNQYRFRDRDAVVLNAEYRRPVAGFLDAVAFVDAGRVFARAGDFGLRELHPAAGFGARFKFGQRVFFGIDLGFSREGKRLWFRSGQMF